MVKRIVLLFAVFVIVGLGCSARVPQQTVTLSETLGQDLLSVQTSYTTLIRTHFDGMRDDVEVFVREKYTPYILKSVIESTNMLDNLNQKVNAGEYADALEYMTDFSNAAIEQIETFRQELLAPINTQETRLLSQVDTAFLNMRRANESITAYLLSVRKLKKEQDYVLSQLQLQELHDTVFSKTVQFSSKVENVLRTAQELDDERVESISNQIEELGNRLNEE